MSQVLNGPPARKHPLAEFRRFLLSTVARDPLKLDWPDVRSAEVSDGS